MRTIFISIVIAVFLGIGFNLVNHMASSLTAHRVNQSCVIDAIK